jgi:hypothetical protein
MLHPGGYLYASFKLGTEERVSKGRYFNDMTAESYQNLISQVEHLEMHRHWTTIDVRPDSNVEWLNTISLKAT